MKYKVIAFLLAVIGYGGLWYFYGWQLPFFLLIALWANNVETKFQ